MSVDHCSGVPAPNAVEAAPLFLSVKPGQYVIVQDSPPMGQRSSNDWWMGQVIWCEGGARDPKVNSLFQIVDVEVDLSHDWNEGLNVENLRLLQGVEFAAQLQQLIARLFLMNIFSCMHNVFDMKLDFSID